jgi:hypothetical protein
MYDGVTTTIDGVKQEYLFYTANNFGSYELRYLKNTGVWTAITTLGIYTIDRIDEIVEYKKGILLIGRVYETATPANDYMVLYWYEEDGATNLSTLGLNATITPSGTPPKPEDAFSLDKKDYYISHNVNQGPSTNDFNGFGSYDSVNDDYKAAWRPDSAYNEYDIDDATGSITAIGRFDVNKLKKTDPQP